MRARGVARFYVHTATVETCTGTNGYGEDIYADQVVLEPPNGCFIDDTQHLVSGATGEQVVSNTTLYTFPANASLFTPNTRVTWASSRGTVTGRVIKTNSNEAPGLNLPDHVAVTLE